MGTATRFFQIPLHIFLYSELIVGCAQRTVLRPLLLLTSHCRRRPPLERVGKKATKTCRRVHPRGSKRLLLEQNIIG